MYGNEVVFEEEGVVLERQEKHPITWAQSLCTASLGQESILSIVTCSGKIPHL